MNELVLEFLQGLLLTVILFVIPFAWKKISEYIDLKQKELITNAYANSAIDLVQSVVDKVTQTYVSSLKKNGKFDQAAQEEALNMAVETIKSLLNTEVAEWINSTYNDLDEWIRTAIESYIARTK